MITELEVPEYYIESVDLDATPTIGEPVVGTVGSMFDPSNPILTDDPPGFQCDARLVFNLYERERAPWDVTDEADVRRFGEIECDFRIYVPGNPEEIRPYVAEWLDTNDYADLDSGFRYHLESGILQHVVSPLGELLESSYNGIVPRMLLS